MLPAQTLFTLFKVKKCTINRNEAYRSSIRLPQLRDTSSTYFKTKKCINTYPSLPTTSKYIKEVDCNKVWTLPTHFSHGFLENDNNYKSGSWDPERCKNVPFGDENASQDACTHNQDRKQYAIKLSLAKYIKFSELKGSPSKGKSYSIIKSKGYLCHTGLANIMLYWYFYL